MPTHNGVTAHLLDDQGLAFVEFRAETGDVNGNQITACYIAAKNNETFRVKVDIDPEMHKSTRTSLEDCYCAMLREEYTERVCADAYADGSKCGFAEGVFHANWDEDDMDEPYVDLLPSLILNGNVCTDEYGIAQALTPSFKNVELFTAVQRLGMTLPEAVQRYGGQSTDQAIEGLSKLFEDAQVNAGPDFDLEDLVNKFQAVKLELSSASQVDLFGPGQISLTVFRFHVSSNFGPETIPADSMLDGSPGKKSGHIGYKLEPRGHKLLTTKCHLPGDKYRRSILAAIKWIYRSEEWLINAGFLKPGQPTKRNPLLASSSSWSSQTTTPSPAPSFESQSAAPAVDSAWPSGRTLDLAFCSGPHPFTSSGTTESFAVHPDKPIPSIEVVEDEVKILEL